jgi:hypothetical protein
MNILELIDENELFKAMQEQESRRQEIPNSYLLIANNKSGKQIVIEVYSQPIMKADKFMGSVLIVSIPIIIFWLNLNHLRVSKIIKARNLV